MNVCELMLVNTCWAMPVNKERGHTSGAKPLKVNHVDGTLQACLWAARIDFLPNRTGWVGKGGFQWRG